MTLLHPYAQEFGEREGRRMADNGSILVTGAAGQLGSVGRTVTGLLLDRGFRFAPWCGAGTTGRRPYEPPAPTWWSATSSNRVMFIASSAAVAGSTSACPCPPGTSKRPGPWRPGRGEDG